MRIYLDDKNVSARMTDILGLLREKRSREVTMIYSAEGMFEISSDRIRKLWMADGDVHEVSAPDFTYHTDSSRILYSSTDHTQIPFPHVSDVKRIATYNIRPNAPMSMVLETGGRSTDCYFTVHEEHNADDLTGYINEFLSLGSNIR